MPPREITSKPNMPEAKASSRGFSLIELLIVVALILVIVAIAVPNYLRARMSANEAAAASYVRTITTASVVYNSTYDNGFPPTLAVLGPPAGGGNTATCDTANLIDEVVAAGVKGGYSYALTGVGDPVNPAGASCSNPGYNNYLVTAVPTSVGSTGQRSFCSDEPASLHYDITGAVSGSTTACETLPALQ
jgi:prepilin-type N-terminal cleavage/methylation domain-containing protein